MASQTNATAPIEMKLEVVVIPVTDVDRAKKFYTDLGWRLDADFVLGEGVRTVQVTPPGSQCSVMFGKGITAAEPGSAQGLYLVVSDVKAAYDALASHGVNVCEPLHRGSGGAPEPGLDPQRRSYNSFVSFRDPDGNHWLLQEITQRLPGRVQPDTEFASPTELADALKRAASAHGRHEESIGHRDEDWPDWYAKDIASEQSGEAAPQ